MSLQSVFVHRAATSYYLGRFETCMEKIMFGIFVAESAAFLVIALTLILPAWDRVDPNT